MGTSRPGSVTAPASLTVTVALGEDDGLAPVGRVVLGRVVLGRGVVTRTDPVAPAGASAAALIPPPPVSAAAVAAGLPLAGCDFLVALAPTEPTGDSMVMSAVAPEPGQPSGRRGPGRPARCLARTTLATPATNMTAIPVAIDLRNRFPPRVGVVMELFTAASVRVDSARRITRGVGRPPERP